MKRLQSILIWFNIWFESYSYWIEYDPAFGFYYPKYKNNYIFRDKRQGLNVLTIFFDNTPPRDFKDAINQAISRAVARVYCGSEKQAKEILVEFMRTHNKPKYKKIKTQRIDVDFKE